MMLTAIQPHWQALLAADPAYAAWVEQDDAAHIAAMAAEEEARRYPYGRPESDTGWYWETQTRRNSQ